ncbi:NAD(+)/NADH kinase [Candidatus Micrarchaeota archaeon]|nr:NAD(+)/NADH kinase [Candidatus Micrarchaeota archaeon]
MKIKIITNPKKEWAIQLEKELHAFFTQLNKGRESIKPTDAAFYRVVRRNADLTICIGGDGTILYASHRKRLEGPVLAIGSETSYICQVNKNNWRSELIPLIEKGNKIKILTLNCEIGAKKYNALNDFVIHATHYRVAEMHTTINSQPTIAFQGDGMIFSTALGSAAYAYSAGGEKLEPTERKISVVPICPYKRAFIPSVLEENSTISVTVGSDCAFINDGIFVRSLRRGEIIKIEKGKYIEFFHGVGSEQKV